MGKTDEELIMEYQSGNIAALEEIFQRYKKAVFNFSLRILGNRADAEDVVGEVFLALSSHRYARREKTKFSTWLFTVAHNCSISRIRKKSRFQDLWFKNKETEEIEEWDIPDNRIDTREYTPDEVMVGSEVILREHLIHRRLVAKPIDRHRPVREAYENVAEETVTLRGV